jgi:hypothetical protein
MSTLLTEDGSKTERKFKMHLGCQQVIAYYNIDANKHTGTTNKQRERETREREKRERASL